MPSPSPTLSELEAFILGLFWQRGPCSPYDIRRHMQSSPSTQWSASAGAIYPVVTKLARLGLVKVKASPASSRNRRSYRATAAGLRAMRAWLGPPLSPQAISVTYDPLRTRVRFLQVLSREKQREWLAAAQTSLDEVELRVKAWAVANASTGPFARFITRNGELELEARRRWLAEIAQQLNK